MNLSLPTFMNKLLYKNSLFTAFRFSFFFFLLITGNSLLAQNIFTGSMDTDWHNASNWSDASVPAIGDPVIIDSDAIISFADAFCNNLTINAGVTLQLSTQSITVNGITTINPTGTINDNANGGINTFNAIINDGDFTTSASGNTEYRFNGDITNNGNFSLAAGSPQYDFTGNSTIENTAASSMRFGHDGSGRGEIISGVTVTISGTSTNVVGLEGNEIQVDGTLINQGNLRINKITGATGGSFTNNSVASYMSSAIPAAAVTLTNNTGSTFKYEIDGGVREGTYHNLELLNTSSFFPNNLNGGIIVNGDLTIVSPNNVLNSNNFNIDLKGNWINNGTFTAGTGTVTFNSTTTPQTITGATTFNNLVINNINTTTPIITLTNNIDVNSLTLTSGKVFLDSHALSFNTTSGASPASYVYMSSGGYVENEVGGDIIFPVGDVSNYQPIQLSNAIIGSKVGFGLPTLAPPSGVGSWLVNNGTTNSNITLLNPQGTGLDTNSKIHRYDGSNWTLVNSSFLVSDYSTDIFFDFNTLGAVQEFSVFTPPVSTPFVTTWITTDGTITIPTTGTGYNYNITWTNQTNTGVGNGSATGITAINYQLTGLENNSTYEISITGDFPHFFMNNNLTEKLKLRTIEQWGNINWTSMDRAFFGCTSLTYGASVDVPNLIGVTDISDMFRDASAFNGDISAWNVSSVTNMASMFNGASAFDNGGFPLIWGLGTSNVTDMSFMFSGATVFNQDLSSWNVSSVTTMLHMFSSANDFNNGGFPLTWTTGTSTTNMSLMFYQAVSFNQAVSSWNVSSVLDMHNMFDEATSFNQDLSLWDVSSVTDMSFMFSQASAFNNEGVLLTWTTSSVTDMQGMFLDATVFNQDISSWNVGKVTNFSRMFENTTVNPSAFNNGNSILNWTTIGADASVSVINMSFMFKNADAFNQDISIWNVGKVSTFDGMFTQADSFNAPLNWTNIGTGVSTVTMSNMFHGAVAFNQDISSWDVSKVSEFRGMFLNASAFNQSLASWQLRTGVTGVNMTNMLDNCAMDLAKFSLSNLSQDGSH